MFDKNLLLRDGSADLTATTTGSAVDFGEGGDIRSLTYQAIFPAAGGTSPTCSLEIHLSDTSAFTVVRRTITFDSITTAGMYSVTFRSPYRYRRYKATIGGTSPNFGKVLIGPVLAGEHSNF